MKSIYGRFLFFCTVLCNYQCSIQTTVPLFTSCSEYSYTTQIDNASQASLLISCAGLGYATYTAWNYYYRYSQEKLFNNAVIMLKGASFWGNNYEIQARDGAYIIKTINSLASAGYRPARIFQAEHPWLFVDAFISEVPPLMDAAEFYNRYAPYSIEQYLALKDSEGFYKAGCLALAHIYNKYNQGISFNVVAPDIRQACLYLDAAASKGHSAAAYEIARLYREGILVAYNEKMAQECITYYARLSNINQHTYPLSTITAWIYKTYYCALHGCPVP